MGLGAACGVQDSRHFSLPLPVTQGGSCGSFCQCMLAASPPKDPAVDYRLRRVLVRTTWCGAQLESSLLGHVVASFSLTVLRLADNLCTQRKGISAAQLERAVKC